MRGQMTALRTRPLGYGYPGHHDRFADDDDSLFENSIDAMRRLDGHRPGLVQCRSADDPLGPDVAATAGMC